MKKRISIALIIGFLASCGNNSISRIENYVAEINERKDLENIVREIREIDLDSSDIEIIESYILKDENGKIPKMTVVLGEPNFISEIYEFYFKNDSLTYAKILKFHKPSTDTIADSQYYYDGIESIEQIDKKKEIMDAETVRQVSEFYLVYGKEIEE